MISEFLQLLSDWRPWDTWITVTAALSAMACTLPGTWLVLRRHSMMGDALSHSALPGVVVAFLVAVWLRSAGLVDAAGYDSALSVALFCGAIGAGLLTAVLTEWIQSLGKLESNAALGVVFTIVFAFGLVLLRMTADETHIDPDCVLFGILELTVFDTIAGTDIPRAAVINAAAVVLNLALMIVLFKELQVSAFDPAQATASGIPARVMHYGLMAATATTAVAAFETVGSILVIGLLIVPAATALLLSDRLKTVVALSLAVAVLSAVLGHVMAKTLPAMIFPRLGFPAVRDAGTAGMMAAATGLFFTAALAFSPRHGLVSRFWTRMQVHVQIVGEDLLGLLYRIEEQHLESARPQAAAVVAAQHGAGPLLSALAVRRLTRRGRIRRGERGLELTEAGRRAGRKLVRAHRLWEAYLQKHFELPDDHLHAAAERTEHFIDAETTAELARELDLPKQDPHGREIPDD